jgi:hypothetical protein
VGVGVGVGVEVGDPSGVAVRVGSALDSPVGVPEGDGVPVGAAVALDVMVALDVAVALGVKVPLGVGMPVEETRVAPGLRETRGTSFPRPQASRVARRATAPAPVKRRRRLTFWREVFAEEGRGLSVMPPS